MARHLMIRNDQLRTRVVDYGNTDKPVLGEVSYAELFSGEITLEDKKIKTASLSSLYKARLIADHLKAQIHSGKFLLSRPVEPLPTNTTLKSLTIR